MNCIYCGTPLSDIDYCTGCGADITILKRVARISNLLYNEGLDKARVRDLSGAIKSLKRSLEFNKENKDARNLLGLVYFESGEVVSALSCSRIRTGSIRSIRRSASTIRHWSTAVKIMMIWQ